ncbi:nitric oxide synthase-interacting protein [Aplysia californica]|uniref:Nitric oxide synthase-interacting protein n=1 Tax=Aplysia californica TaxID=6500 RepID=A0ABM0K563_APLCA|nr:nitric oxide synthase-interacting protein [Aplysia californica]
MTRHGRNCTAGTVYTYHERQKDTKASGYGSKSVRFGKDAIKEFDCCCLTLQPCKDPVITEDGHLYDKEAVLKNILHQKKEIARKLKEYEKQKNKTDKELQELAKAEQEAKASKFKQQESNPIGEKYLANQAAEQKGKMSSLSNVEEGRDKKLPSFWIPTLTPQAEATKIEKPDEKVRCPMSGKVLKFKDLIPVKFTPINDRDAKTSVISKTNRYVCAVTNDVLGNSVPCAVLRPSGAVVTVECVDKIIRKEMLDPICGKKLAEKDIIPLQRGASGFTSAGVTLEAKKAGPTIMA